MGSSQYDEKSLLVSQTILDLGVSTNWTLSTWGAKNGSFRIDLISVKSSSVASATLTVGQATDAAAPEASVPMASAIIPAGAGDGTVPLVNFLDLAFWLGFPGLLIPATYYLTFKLGVALGAGEEINILLQGGELS